MSKKAKTKQLQVRYILGGMACLAIIVGVGAAFIIMSRDRNQNNRDKQRLTHAFDKIVLPPNLKLQSSNFQIAAYPPDPSLGLSGKIPELTYDYAIVGTPNTTEPLVAELAQSFEQAGYKVGNQAAMYELDDLSVFKANPEVDIDVTFNHDTDAYAHPFSANYRVTSATFKVDGAERREPVSY